MQTLIGVNPDFVVVYDPQYCVYDVYYKGKFLIGNKYRYREIASYLN